ncbi:hypothetical protein BC834DRAFT_857979 [Gloeopeniophorella convolvens]|nr:hypothetical protein BC834DRAFT_857979 [Gloeopeniophorella convolvens]
MDRVVCPFGALCLSHGGASSAPSAAPRTSRAVWAYVAGYASAAGMTGWDGDSVRSTMCTRSYDRADAHGSPAHPVFA